MTDLVYLDLETTGLSSDIHEAWEVAWAVNDGEIFDGLLEHSLRTADPFALELNHYADRQTDRVHIRDHELQKIVKGNTLVIANPPFDRGFLHKRWGVEPWHHRSIDIESVAMTVFGWDRPKGMKEIRDAVVDAGYGIISPDHSARKDVQALRSCYSALLDIQRKYRYGYDEYRHGR